MRSMGPNPTSHPPAKGANLDPTQVSSVARAPVLIWWLLGAAGTTAVFVFAFRFIQHHFSTRPYLYDSAWFSYAIWQKGFILPNPPHIFEKVGNSLFTQHIYGHVSLAYPLGHLFSTHYDYFATIIGVTYALAFLAPFLAILVLFATSQRRSALHAVVAFVAGLSFAFSGPVIAAMGYPHFEVAIPCLFVLFLALHFLGFRRAQWAPLIMGLIVREDAGLHYFGYLSVLWFYQRVSLREHLPNRTLMHAAAISVLASGTMLFIQRVYFPFGESMFHKSYIGDPPLAHLQLSEFWTRISKFAADSKHNYIPALVIALGAVFFRIPGILLLYASCIPWVLINVLCSLTPAAKTLSLYYAFPLLAGLLWPLFAPHLMPTARRLHARELAVGLFITANIASQVVLSGHAFVRDAAVHGGNLKRHTYFHLEDCLRAEFQENPGLYADPSVVAMFPHTVPADRMRLLNADTDGSQLDAVIFYRYPETLAFAEKAGMFGLDHALDLRVLPIGLLSRKPLRMGECLATDRNR